MGSLLVARAGIVSTLQAIDAGTRAQDLATVNAALARDEVRAQMAALATVLSAAGAAATPESLVEEVYLPGRRDSLQVALMAAARRHACSWRPGGAPGDGPW